MPDDPQAVYDKLSEKGATTPCNACGQTDFKLEAQTFLTTYDDGKVNPLHGIPALPVVCSNCGYIRLHATGTLGI